MASYDLSTPAGRARAYWDFLWGDHAFLRLGFSNAHWIGPDMIRANQPWPFQLKWWARRGLKTVINLRGGFDSAFYALEKDACERYGLRMVDATMYSREIPSRERMMFAQELFQTIEYPALMHCKSGADRAGIMSVLYRHFHLGEPIREAVKELGFRTLHVRQGKTGVLDYMFERYLTEAESQGIAFMDWVMSDAYDPVAMKKDFQASWWGTLVSDRLLRRE
ncbi:protein tyrosine phosphatase [Brevundimonas sp.]|uniref:fused DSP-PTPase phosphatase/NAD kinase-like protein n=1 Tax=Brevundimonas sp. TaxID=1871086 RepID=UPI0025D5EB9B|nr:protein tyrosine phosphatase [Brevundimonas sp.]